MVATGSRTDEQLLAAAAHDVDAFAELYGRYERPLAAFFVRATGSGELAADLTAETFAQALSSLNRYDPELGAGGAWLYGIARNLLARSRERGQVEDRARRQLGMEPVVLDDTTVASIESLAHDSHALTLLRNLPDDQRQAVAARVVDERSYEEIAAALQLSQSVVRKRVSRGLATLRARFKEGR